MILLCARILRQFYFENKVGRRIRCLRRVTMGYYRTLTMSLCPFEGHISSKKKKEIIE